MSSCESFKTAKEIFSRYYDCHGKQIVVSEKLAGYDNLNYLITCGKFKYVLRHYRSTAKDQVLQELELLAMLNSRGFPALEIIKNIAGKNYVEINHKIFMVYKYIPEGGKEVTIQDVVPLVCKLHNISEGFNTGHIRSRFYEVEREFLELADQLEQKIEQIDVLIRIIGEWIENSNNVEYARIRRSWIHHDLNRGNFIRSDKNQVHLIDFDECYYGPIIIDIASIIYNWSIVDNKMDLEKAAQIYRAYNDLNPLTCAEKAGFPIAVLQYFLHRTIEYVRDYVIPSNEQNKTLSISRSFCKLLHLKNNMRQLAKIVI